MNSAWTWVAVAGGGAIGATARYAVGVSSKLAFGAAYPWSTLIVNALGCFLMGVLVHWFALREPNPEWLRGFLAVGVLGGFTTFSAFALDFVTLYREKATLAAAAYIVASVGLSIGGLFAGLLFGRALL